MKNIKVLTIAAAAASILLAVPASAETRPLPAMMRAEGGIMMRRENAPRPPVLRKIERKAVSEIMKGDGLAGKVSAVSGTTLTVSANQGFGSTTVQVSYSVDASSATVVKAGAASSVSAIALGDMVFVQGTVTGTNIIAKTIRDGEIGKRVMIKALKNKDSRGENQQGQDGSPGEQGGGDSRRVPPIMGNGQPVVAGNVVSISGSSIVISNKSSVQFTVDAANAKITKGGLASSTVSNISVGDSLLVQGVVTGNSVAASSILDGGTPPAHSGAERGENAPESRGAGTGIRSFLGRIFGF